CPSACFTVAAAAPPERLCRAIADTRHPTLLARVALGGSVLVVPFAHVVTGFIPVDSIHERLLIDLRERLNDRFESDLPGTWLGCLSGRCVQRAPRRVRAISGRLLPCLLLGLLDQPTLAQRAFTRELCHRGLLLAA